MWADVWEAALQETDVFLGMYEHSCSTLPRAHLMTITCELSHLLLSAC